MGDTGGEPYVASASQLSTPLVIGIASGVVAGALGCLTIIACLFYRREKRFRGEKSYNSCIIPRVQLEDISAGQQPDLESGCGLGRIFVARRAARQNSPRAATPFSLARFPESTNNGAPGNAASVGGAAFLSVPQTATSRATSGWSWLPRRSTRVSMLFSPQETVATSIETPMTTPAPTSASPRRNWFRQSFTASVRLLVPGSRDTFGRPSCDLEPQKRTQAPPVDTNHVHLRIPDAITEGSGHSTEPTLDGEGRPKRSFESVADSVSTTNTSILEQPFPSPIEEKSTFDAVSLASTSCKRRTRASQLLQSIMAPFKSPTQAQAGDVIKKEPARASDPSSSYSSASERSTLPTEFSIPEGTWSFEEELRGKISEELERVHSIRLKISRELEKLGSSKLGVSAIANDNIPSRTFNLNKLPSRDIDASDAQLQSEEETTDEELTRRYRPASKPELPMISRSLTPIISLTPPPDQDEAFTESRETSWASSTTADDSEYEDDNESQDDTGTEEGEAEEESDDEYLITDSSNADRAVFESYCLTLAMLTSNLRETAPTVQVQFSRPQQFLRPPGMAIRSGHPLKQMYAHGANGEYENSDEEEEDIVLGPGDGLKERLDDIAEDEEGDDGYICKGGEGIVYRRRYRSERVSKKTAQQQQQQQPQPLKGPTVTITPPSRLDNRRRTWLLI